MQLRSSIKAFVATRLGRIVLLAIITLALAGSATYLGYFIAIPVFVLTGLGLPIYLGWNRPRTLFLIGLTALLVAAPIVNAGTVVLLMTPAPAANGVVFAPHTQSVLQNALVHPYTRDNRGNFNFTVDVNPAFLPNGSGPKVLWVVFYVSNCPNAVTANSTACAPNYPFYFVNRTYNSTNAMTETFVQNLGGINVWYWTVSAAFVNSTGKVVWTYLSFPNNVATAEGPVTGDFLGLYIYILPAIYVTVFLYPGLVFFLALLVYIFLKSRQRRRAGGAPAVPTPSTPPARPAPAALGPAAAPAPARTELACPKCGAVVYQGETRCWKCGSALTSTATPAKDQPLASGKP